MSLVAPSYRKDGLAASNKTSLPSSLLSLTLPNLARAASQVATPISKPKGDAFWGAAPDAVIETIAMVIEKMLVLSDADVLIFMIFHF